MAALPPLDGPLAISYLLSVCSFSAQQQNAIILTEGLSNIALIKSVADNDVSHMAERLSRLSVARGGCYIGTVQINNFRALLWWLEDITAQGIALVPTQWNQLTMAESIIRLKESRSNEKKSDSVESPKKINPNKWTDQHSGFMNFLRSTLSSDKKRTLAYVVRQNPPVGYTPVSREEQMMYSAPLIGVHYESDNIAVYQAIKQWCLDTAAWAWVRTYDKDQDGRAAMEALRQHYDGPGETRRQLAKAKADLKVIHYKNEQSLAFETYIHKLNEVFFCVW